ncbi:hypothetical protein [Pedobacter sp. UC225_65]|uniref:hypothetical protein n=1 Tax=Pedobacter sp. UC225_65 TaxID=3350173 RepID=UPI00366B70FA
MTKRTILALISLLPLASFGQAYSEPNNSGIGSVVGILLGIGICVVIFMVLRQAFLWYWKVEVIIKKQDEQIQLLKGIYKSIEENNRLTQSQIELTIGKEENKV